MNVFTVITPKSATYYLNTNTTIRQALETFDYHKFTVVPIIDKDGNYVTTVSEGDILRYIKNTANFDIKKAENVRVIDIEHYRSYASLSSVGTFDDMYDLIIKQNFIPIVDDRNKYIGIIKRKEFLKYLRTNKE